MWQAAPEWQPTRELVERLTAVGDWCELLFATNIVFEQLVGSNHDWHHVSVHYGAVYVSQRRISTFNIINCCLCRQVVRWGQWSDRLLVLADRVNCGRLHRVDLSL